MCQCINLTLEHYEDFSDIFAIAIFALLLKYLRNLFCFFACACAYTSVCEYTRARARACAG